MRIKKIAAILLVMTVVAGVLSVNTFASHGYRRTTGGTSCTICPVEDCTQAGVHDHDGTAYCAYAGEDGQTCHSNGTEYNGRRGHH